MGIRLLLVAENNESREAYIEALSRLDVLVDCIASPEEMNTILAEDKYNGLLVDVPTMIRCESPDKNRISRIMERFPVLRLIYNKEFGGIRGVAYGGTVRDNRDIMGFVEQECLPFTPRSIRQLQRQELVFNVLLFREQSQPESVGERTVTINVSEKGCFVCSMADWQVQSPAWIVVNEFEDKTPIELKVRWRRNWGQFMLLPGIGASFESISDNQLEQLSTYL